MPRDGAKRGREVLSIFFEHDSITRALQRTGEIASSVTNDPVESTASVFVAWSSRDALLLRPECAWLSIQDVIFVRLPTELDDLRRRLRLTSRARDQRTKFEGLKTPLGQWRWAVGELRRTLEVGNFDEVYLRLDNLRRFSTKHWPGWYEETLADLRGAIESRHRVEDAMNALIARAGDIATLEACSPIISWMEQQEKVRRITFLLDALCYASQELVPTKNLAEWVANDPWWREFETSLSNAEESVAEIQLAEGPLPRNVIDVLTGLRGALVEMKYFEKLMPNASLTKIRHAYAAADTLVRLICDLMSAKSRILIFLRNSIGVRER